MLWWCWALACCLLFGCGKTSSNDAASGQATEGAVATGTTGTTATARVTTTGVTSSCTSPEDRECSGECVDPRTNSAHCGFCNTACSDDEECVQARCVPQLRCDAADTHYASADMQASGGEERDDGWALPVGETLVVEHRFQPGPALLLLTARRTEGALRPAVTLTIGDETVGPLLLAAASHASYSIEYESPGAVELVSISVAPAAGSGSDVVAVIEGLEVRDCAASYGACDGGGYYLPEMHACAPPVCSEPADCTRDFVGQAFLGVCSDGACEYPSCREPGASGRPLHEELDGPDTNVTCFSYSELTFPHNNPHVASLEGDPQDFTCPAIETLTWEVERFRGETSCVQVPICGPNSAEDLGFEPNPNHCCYLVSWTCGV